MSTESANKTDAFKLQLVQHLMIRMHRDDLLQPPPRISIHATYSVSEAYIYIWAQLRLPISQCLHADVSFACTNTLAVQNKQLLAQNRIWWLQVRQKIQVSLDFKESGRLDCRSGDFLCVLRTIVHIHKSETTPTWLRERAGGCEVKVWSTTSVLQ